MIETPDRGLAAGEKGMLKLRSKPKVIGTSVPCPACRYPNLGIDIWCERCGTPLDWNGQKAAVEAPVAERQRRRPRDNDGLLYRPAAAIRIDSPSLQQRQFVPRLPRPVWIGVSAAIAILLVVQLARVLFPSSPTVAANVVVPSDPQAAAVPGVEAKTGLHYTTAKCAPTGPCLAFVSETLGQGAAAVVFSTAASGGRECVGYLYHVTGGWHFLDATCGLPEQISPMVGHDATVRVASNCANVRAGAGFKARVVACVHDGSLVHVDGGPTFVDGLLWWHEPQGWIAHEFLFGP